MKRKPQKLINFLTELEETLTASKAFKRECQELRFVILTLREEVSNERKKPKSQNIKRRRKKSSLVDKKMIRKIVKRVIDYIINLWK